MTCRDFIDLLIEYFEGDLLEAQQAELISSFIACGGGSTPLAPTPIPTPTPSPNQPPQIVTATITPTSGIDQLTTFNVRVEVRDPDGDQVTLKLIGCFLDDVPAVLDNGVANLSFKTNEKCGLEMIATATDSKWARTRATLPYRHIGLGGIDARDRHARSREIRFVPKMY